MSVQARRCGPAPPGVQIETFTVVWMVVEAAVSMLVLFPLYVSEPPLPKSRQNCVLARRRTEHEHFLAGKGVKAT